MRRLLLAAALVTAPALARAAAAARPAAPPADPQPTGMVSLSLVEALAAIKQPQLAGVFAFVQEKDAPFAFADLLARDQKSMKRYLEKLDEDKKVADGLTAWDHSVCASLVNLYASPMAGTFGKPDDKRLSKINDCVLSQVVPLEEVVARRKK